MSTQESVINRFIIHALTEGKPHTATIDHYTRGEALWLFYVNSPFDTMPVVQSVDELGPLS
jgi:hypothetical protein